MVSLLTTDKFSISLATVPAGSQIDGPPTYPVDVANVVVIVPSSDGLSASVVGHTAGTCTITPSALANGVVVTGPPVQVTVSLPVPPPPPPPVFATSLDVTVGAVVPQ